MLRIKEIRRALDCPQGQLPPPNLSRGQGWGGKMWAVFLLHTDYNSSPGALTCGLKHQLQHFLTVQAPADHFSTFSLRVSCWVKWDTMNIPGEKWENMEALSTRKKKTQFIFITADNVLAAPSVVWIIVSWVFFLSTNNLRPIWYLGIRTDLRKRKT